MSHWRITGVDSFMYSRSLLRIKIDIFCAKSGLRALNDLSEMVPWSFGGRLATVVSPANYFCLRNIQYYPRRSFPCHYRNAFRLWYLTDALSDLDITK